MTRGTATGKRNSCLVHTLMQLVAPSAPDTPGGMWADEVRRSIEIRGVLAAMDPLLSAGHGYLSLALHWRPILIALEKNPADFRVVCYTSTHGREEDGDGSRVLSMFNHAFSHYDPLRATTPFALLAPATDRN